MRILLTILAVRAFVGVGVFASVNVDYAYLRKMSEKDIGTIHVFLRNEGPRQAGVIEVRVAGAPLPLPDILGVPNSSPEVEMCADPNSAYIWCQAVPNPIPPKAVGDVMVRLRKPLETPTEVEVLTTSGPPLRCVVSPDKPPVWIAAIRFERTYKRAHIYVQNDGDKPATLTSVWFDTRDVTPLLARPLTSIASQGKSAFAVNLPKPLSSGRYLSVKLCRDDAPVAQALVRVWSLFPIQVFGKDTRPEMFFDPERFYVRYSPRADTSAQPSDVMAETVHFLMDGPDVRDRDHKGPLGAKSGNVLHRAATSRFQDPLRPTTITVAASRLDDALYVYGETVDILAPMVYGLTIQHRDPRGDGQLADIAKLACAPKPVVSVIEAFDPGKMRVEWQRNRCPTAEEIRLIVYEQASRGINGVWYFCPGERGYDGDPLLRREIGRINAELQILKRFLVIGEPMPLIQGRRRWDRAILCGDRAIVLFMINQNYSSYFDDKGAPFLYRPLTDGLRALVRIPDGMVIRDVFRVGGDFSRVKYNVHDQCVEIHLERLDLTAQFVLTTDANDYSFDSDGDGVSDIEEVVALLNDVPLRSSGGAGTVSVSPAWGQQKHVPSLKEILTLIKERGVKAMPAVVDAVAAWGERSGSGTNVVLGGLAARSLSRAFVTEAKRWLLERADRRVGKSRDPEGSATLLRACVTLMRKVTRDPDLPGVVVALLPVCDQKMALRLVELIGTQTGADARAEACLEVAKWTALSSDYRRLSRADRDRYTPALLRTVRIIDGTEHEYVRDILSLLTFRQTAHRSRKAPLDWSVRLEALGALRDRWPIYAEEEAAKMVKEECAEEEIAELLRLVLEGPSVRSRTESLLLLLAIGKRTEVERTLKQVLASKADKASQVRHANARYALRLLRGGAR